MKPMKLTKAISSILAMATLSSLSGQLNAAPDDPSAVAETANANNQFALDLYQQLSKENEGKNLFFSPYSISSALAMTAEGARGETAAEMARVLHFPMADGSPEGRPWSSSLIHAGFKEINGSLDRASNAPLVAEKRKQLEALRAKLAETKKVTEDAKDWKAKSANIEKERELAAQINGLAAAIDPFELNIANAIWAQKDFKIEAPFRETIENHYGTDGFRDADFKENAEGERQQINRWVEGETKDRIKDLIAEGVLNDETRMVLVNAIYFKGDWATPFTESDTKEVDFTLTNGTKRKTATMHGGSKGVGYAAFHADGSRFDTPDEVPSWGDDDGPARYPGDGGFAMARLPYKGDELSMILMAPMKHDGLSALEQKLDAANLEQWISMLETRETRLVLPKFKLETNYDLGTGGSAPSGTLPVMGMKRAFTDPRLKNSADFSGMHVPASSMDALYVAKVIHKAFLEVNEKGTEAAAATAVAMAGYASLPPTMPFVPVFAADKPFLMLIRDDATGSILFMGRVVDPS